MNTATNFLHIPDGEAVTVTLIFPTGLERTGQFGKYYIYTVIHEGQEKTFKATERLEKQLRKAQVQAGQEIQLRKESITPRQGESYSVINLVSGNGNQATLFPAAVQSEASHAGSADELRMLSDALADPRTICKFANEPSIIPEITLAVGLFLAAYHAHDNANECCSNKKQTVHTPDSKAVKKKKTKPPSGIL